MMSLTPAFQQVPCAKTAPLTWCGFFTIETDPFDSHWQQLHVLLAFWSF